MKKYIAISIVIVVIAGIAGAVYVTMSESRISSGSVSDRTKEYIQQQKSGNDSLWRNVDFDSKGKGPREVAVSKVGCFAFTLPFLVYREHERDGCAVFISIDEPRGNMTASLDNKAGRKLDNDSAVMLRRSKPGVYTEDEITTGGKSFVSFKSTEEGYERTAFYKTEKGLFTLSLTANTNEDLDPRFKIMLETLNFE